MSPVFGTVGRVARERHGRTDRNVAAGRPPPRADAEPDAPRRGGGLGGSECRGVGTAARPCEAAAARARARRRREGITRGRTTRHGPVDVAERRARDPAIGQAVLCLVAGRSASRAREVRKALGAATGATAGALASAGEATARSGTRAWALLSGCWNGPRPCPGPEAQDALDRADAHNGHARRPHRVRDGAAVRVPRRAPQSCARPLAAQLP